MGAPDFSKLVSHPEKQKIISKLLSGDPPKTISEYLKAKYDTDTSMHLSINLLTEFKTKWLDKPQFIDKIVKDQQAGKLDKKIADSLMNNKTWQERVIDRVDSEIDLKQKIRDTLVRVEARAEQVFDAIQQNPTNVKLDYVMIKYFEILSDMIEKADKIINERPDTLIQNNISIQMVEQHSVALQEAIREALREFSPEDASKFMEILAKHLNKMKPDKPLTIEEKHIQADRLIPAEFEDSIATA